MKKSNIYQMHKHGSFVKRELTALASARVAIGELTAMGFTPLSFSLGQRASITVEEPHHKEVRVALPFEAVSIGFNGAFHYTTFGAVFGGFAVEWRRRRMAGITNVHAVHSRALKASRLNWY